jgi:hypothetical protein
MGLIGRPLLLDDNPYTYICTHGFLTVRGKSEVIKAVRWDEIEAVYLVIEHRRRPTYYEDEVFTTCHMLTNDGREHDVDGMDFWKHIKRAFEHAHPTCIAFSERLDANTEREGTHLQEEPLPPELVVDSLHIETVKRRVTYRGQDLELSDKGFDLLVYLIRYRGIVLTYDQLRRAVRGYEYRIDRGELSCQIRILREKLEDDPKHPQLIQTVRSVGYVFRGW